jgi:cholesterol oxidase
MSETYSSKELDPDKPSHVDVHWLSQGAEKLVARIKKDEHGEVSYCPSFDVLVVGSGYGGAVAAARFAGTTDTASEKATSVAVLERGREYAPGSFPSRFADLAGHVRFTSADGTGTKGGPLGLFDLKLSPDMSALVGNGLGGGSLINAGVMERPSASSFASQKLRWPKGISYAELTPYFEKAEDNLRAVPLPDDDGVPAPARLTSLLAMGERFDGAKVRRPDLAVNFIGPDPVLNPCVRCGDCFTGCNIGAKRSTDTNYLADAYRRGAQIFTGATVLYVEPDRKGVPSYWRVYFTLTDPKISRSDRGPFYLLAKRVVLAAGTFGSTEILMRSRTHGLSLSPTLGKGFSGNGDMIAVALNQPAHVNAAADEAIPLQSRRSGPTITGMIDLRTNTDDKRQFVIEEMAVPAALRRVFEETITTFGALYSLGEKDPSLHRAFKSGEKDSAAIDPDQANRTAVYAIMGIDSADGQFQFPREATKSKSDGWLVVRWPQLHGRHSLSGDSMYQQQIKCLQELQKTIAVNGIAPPKVIPYPLWRPLSENMAELVDLKSGALFTVHPLGGCSMGDNVQLGVVDDLGQVFTNEESGPDGVRSHHGLVVLDGSIVPCALGINPALTIAALAERSCARLKKQWRLQDNSGLTDVRTLSLRRMRPLARPVRSRTAIQLAERMTGKVRLPDGSIGYLAIELEFNVIKDLMKFVRQGRKRLKVLRGRSYVRQYSSRAQMNAHQAGPRAADAKTRKSSPVREGRLEYLQRKDSNWRQRAWATGPALLLNRLLRDVRWGLARSWQLFGIAKQERGLRPLLQRIDGWELRLRRFVVTIWQLLTHVGEVRTLRYDLTLDDNLDGGLKKDGRLVGIKTISYCRFGNPWRQLMEMSLDYYPPGKSRQEDAYHLTTPSEPLRIDLGYFAQREQPLLKVVQQTDAPTTWADLTSLALYLGRIIGRIHFWSFRAPDERSFDWPQNLAARLPGFIAGVPEPQVIELQDPGRAAQGRFIRLARYAPRSSRFARQRDVVARNPVVLLHGFGASGSTFAHRSIPNNLVQLLTGQGYEAWVVELRTSIGLLSSRQAFDFELMAREDVVAAIDEVRYRTGKEEVDVIAHCVGAAMFCIAALGGDLKGKIGAVVLSQVGPVTVFHSNNVFRGYMAAYLRRFLGTQIFDADVSPYRSNIQRAVDRALSTYPYADEEAKYEHPPFAARPHLAIRHRADAIFGQLYASKNVTEGVTERLDELIGHVHVDSMAQLMFYARHRQLTSADGLRSLLDRKAIRENFAFPVLFLFGADNQVFDRAGINESRKLLNSQFVGGDKTGPKPFQRRIYKNLGHQDGLIGPRLADDVFPDIDDFLRLRRPLRPIARSLVPPEEAAPRFGPVIGWLKADSTGAHACVALGAPVAVPNAQWESITMSGAPLTVQPRIDASRASSVAPSTSPQASGSVIRLMLDVAHLYRNARKPPSAARPIVMRDSEFVDYALVERSDLSKEARVEIRQSALLAIDDPRIQPERLRFALGSCQYPAGLIDGDPAAASFVKLNTLLDRDDPPQFLILAGDQIYVDETAGLFDVGSPVERYVRPHENFFSKPAVKKALMRLPAYCMLDDHEIFDNWEPPLRASQDGKAAQSEAYSAFEAFEQYQWNMGPGPSFDHRAAMNPVPAELSPAPNGHRRYWYHFSPGGFGMFMMDTRTERDRRTLRKLGSSIGEDAQRTEQINHAKIVSEEQFSALEDWLKKLQTEQGDTPKSVVTPSVVFPWYKDVEHNRLYAARCDGWDGYRASLRRLLSFIGRNQIQNVIFLSGDYHLSCFAHATIEAGGGKPVLVRSVVSSGMYAPYPFANATPNELALQSGGAWISDATLSCAVEAMSLMRHDGKADDRIDKRAVTDDGFAVVEVDLQPDGAWRVDVEFHATSGVFYTLKSLATVMPESGSADLVETAVETA